MLAQFVQMQNQKHDLTRKCIGALEILKVSMKHAFLPTDEICVVCWGTLEEIWLSRT